MLNKSFFTNLIAVLIIAIGYFCPVEPELMKSIGFFALSGAVTNWLAIHMLFEKIPFLYGSGVIPNRFGEFKLAIKDLMMRQFFTQENVEQFIEAEEQQGSHVLNIDPLLNAIDYDKIYEGLVASIMESSFGAMLQMMGGEQALVPLREPFMERMKTTLRVMVESERFKEVLKQGLDSHKVGQDIITKIETVIDKRLNELTPQLVKEMVQQIIKVHLGWLVVWGGIFGGVLGAIFSFA
ncbi:MAG TPA: DUF445 domain-containing protein [Methylococcaceae bacterium]|nr:DUF445 domain-containing protein [Methylococcaceae bacterium]HIB61829.1 DUF445 domain-containing protein [Methylococcaceae bacterium]HIN68946.1 DUF445 domain-containing protein [Methylococcales bacterium]HIO43979.1 DUF445 domain-containing protein [Methylococcales bacterium]